MRYHARAGCYVILVLAAVTLLCAPVSAQGIRNYERSLGRDMLRSVREQLEESYYDPTFHGIDLRTAAARADSQIRAAQSTDQIARIIAAFVLAFDDSHTSFFPPQRIEDIEYGWDMQMVGDSCYVVGVEDGSDAAAKGLLVGDRIIAVDGYRPSRRDFSLLWHSMHEIDPRLVVRLDLEAADGTRRALGVHAKLIKTPRRSAPLVRRIVQSAREQFAEADLGNGVLILRPGWFGDRYEIDRIMARAHGAGTLVLDLRGNRGGRVDGLVRLVGHVFDRRVVIDTTRGRRHTRVEESKPVGHPFTGALLVLIDSRSGSSSEVFAYLVQLEGRGVVVGDRSAGAVMESMLYDLVSGGGEQVFYGLSVTVADVIMPDGVRLENRGVQPDALVLPTAADLAAQRDPALAMALTLAGYPTDAARAGTLLPQPGRGP